MVQQIKAKDIVLVVILIGVIILLLTQRNTTLNEKEDRYKERINKLDSMYRDSKIKAAEYRDSARVERLRFDSLNTLSDSLKSVRGDLNEAEEKSINKIKKLTPDEKIDYLRSVLPSE